MRRACSVTSSRVISHEFRIGRSTVPADSAPMVAYFAT